MALFYNRRTAWQTYGSNVYVFFLVLIGCTVLLQIDPVSGSTDSWIMDNVTDKHHSQPWTERLGRKGRSPDIGRVPRDITPLYPLVKMTDLDQYVDPSFPKNRIKIPVEWQFQPVQWILFSYGPGYFGIIKQNPLWAGPWFEHTRYYSFEPTNVSDDYITLFPFANRRHFVSLKSFLFNYPVIPCPEWVSKNRFCDLYGDMKALRQGDNFVDWVLDNCAERILALYMSTAGEEFEGAWRMLGGCWKRNHNLLTVRTYPCDPTRNCAPLTTPYWISMPFVLRTTDPLGTMTVDTADTGEYSSTEFTETRSIEPRTTGWREEGKAREFARRWWPIPFVLCLIALFFVLPFIYIWAKRKAEKEAVNRWFRATSPDKRVSFLLQIPPAWPPGWPPGPREPAPTRAYMSPPPHVQRGERGATGEPPAKRPR